MGKKKVPEDHWAHYRSIQLTAEQKAEARKELDVQIERARREGVYEELLKWIGKVDWPNSIEEGREDRD